MSILKNKTILFIGCGNMASAIIGGLVCNDMAPHRIYAIDRNSEKLKNINKQYNIRTSENITNINLAADIVILAVKPNAIRSACAELTNIITANTLVISVAAGVTQEKLTEWLPEKTKIIRSMPNTPATVGMGATILYSNLDSSTPEDKIYFDLAEALFKSVGITVWVKHQNEINTLMAISGCGPAYVFLVCESLMAAAKNLDIEPQTAKKLITATIAGACELYKNSDKSANVLRREVTSPNGTTEAAVNILNPEESAKTYIKALQAAVNRATIIEQELN